MKTLWWGRTLTSSSLENVILVSLFMLEVLGALAGAIFGINMYAYIFVFKLGYSFLYRIIQVFIVSHLGLEYETFLDITTIMGTSSLFS